MNAKIKRIILWFSVVFSCGLIGVSAMQAANQNKVSKPGVYRGYSEPVYDGFKRFSQYVEVRDGTKLAMDYYLPTLDGKVVESPHPVIFTFTPYGRAIKMPGGKLILTPVNNPLGFSIFGGLTRLVLHGYAVAVADCRGTYASYGVRKATNDTTEAEDAHDLVQWLGEQPWSNGDVGMTGCSYVGATVNEAIRTMPPNLKAAFYSADFSAYDAKGQGCLLRGPSKDADGEQDLKLSAPVDGDTDEDGDGYPDMLYEAAMEHKNNPPAVPFLQSVPYRDSWSDISESIYWEEASTSNYLEEIAQSNIPVYVYGGWYDFMRHDTLLIYKNWPNPVKALIGPWPHCGNLFDPTFNTLNELHRFFDYWLKGIDNGIMDEPPIYFATDQAPICKRWQYAADFPLPAGKPMTYYLDAGAADSDSSINNGVLSPTSPSDENAKDDYTSDYDIKTNTDWYMGTPRPKGKELDAKGLTYTTDPLPEDTRIQGHPMVTLWISSNEEDAGLFLTIEDVDERGKSIYVGDGRLKASMRQTHEPPFDNLSLPWHRGYEEDAQPLVPGAPTELSFNMLPMSYVFKAGHRIRLVITSAVGGWFVNIPTYDPPSQISVFRDAEHPSSITLPLAPDNATVFNGTAKVNLSNPDRYTYRGTAKLYALESAVYLLLGERWFHWDTKKHWHLNNQKHYRCGQDSDPLEVTIKHNEDRTATVMVTGDGIRFNGRSIRD